MSTLSSSKGKSLKGDQFLGGMIEAVVLLLAFLSPWFFGAVPPFDIGLFLGVAFLLVLWSFRLICQGRFSWTKCPVSLCLAGLFLLGMVQVLPLPESFLAWLSPGTSSMYHQLLPGESEIIAEEKKSEPTQELTRGATLSLNPGATRKELINLLAVFLLFVIVRNNISSSQALRRLSWVALINGALLSLFGLMQFFTSPTGTLFGVPTFSQGFGPFICRNHFPFYANMCFGLGLGLLLAESGRPLEKQGHYARQWNPLQKPSLLWITLALGIIGAGTVVCLSRGGFLALLGTGVICQVLWIRRWTRTAHLGLCLLVVGLMFGLVFFLGLDPIVARLATVWEGEAFQESRLPLWSRCFPLIAQFPWWGTGYGTFQWVEPLQRTLAGEEAFFFENAHNEYLEALVEGGLVRLTLSLAAVAWIFHLGYRGLRRLQKRPEGYLALGALFGFTTILFHSIVDFGLHIPAITFLATVLAAQICNLGKDPPETKEKVVNAPLSPGGKLVPLLGMVVACIIMSLVLCGESWRAFQVNRLWSASWSLHQLKEPKTRATQTSLLGAAVRLAPGNARLRLELGKEHFLWFGEKTERLAHLQTVLEAVDGTTRINPGELAGGSPDMGLVGGTSLVLSSLFRQTMVMHQEEILVEQHLFPALENFRLARDLCPLLSEPHVALASHASRLAKADKAGVYMSRARLVAPANPRVWFLSGIKEFQEGAKDRAYLSWRRSLELSESFLPEILELTAKELSFDDLLQKILPDQPAILMAAASRLFPEGNHEPARHLFLEKALVLLGAKGESLTGPELYLQASAHVSLGQIAPGLAAYQSALEQEPRQIGWRLEFAQVCCAQQKWQEAKREVQTILEQQPAHSQARALLTQITLEIAKNR